MNYLGSLLTREKLGKGAIKSLVILDTSTKSLGKFGIHLNFLKKIIGHLKCRFGTVLNA